MALYQQHTETYTHLTADNKSPVLQEQSKKTQSALLTEILKEAAKSHYDKAISLSRKHGGHDLDIVNARGVCLMRTGKYDEAVALFRSLVLQPGCTWMRKDRPVHYKTNLATALLLSGRPSGCLEMLHELAAEAPPTAGALRSTIKRWESTLPFWAWLNWKTGRIAPVNRPVPMDFEPGDFEGEIVLADAESGEGQTSPPRNAA